MKYAVLCSGQGTQHPDMLRLLDGHEGAQALFRETFEALGFDPREALADPAERYRNRNAQPLYCAWSLAAWRALSPHVPAPAAFAGYSIGELAAHACAGAANASEIAKLARQRARRMDDAAGTGSGLIALRGAPADIAALAGAHPVHLAIETGPHSRIYGGSRVALDDVAREAPGIRVTATILNVEIAAHTPLIAAAVETFRADLAASNLGNPAIPVIAGIDARPVRQRERAIDTLARQVAEPIRWGDCLEALAERDCRVFLELGPGRALAGHVRDRWPDALAHSLDEFASLDGAIAWLRRALTTEKGSGYFSTEKVT